MPNYEQNFLNMWILLVLAPQSSLFLIWNHFPIFCLSFQAAVRRRTTKTVGWVSDHRECEEFLGKIRKNEKSWWKFWGLTCILGICTKAAEISPGIRTATFRPCILCSSEQNLTWWRLLVVIHQHFWLTLVRAGLFSDCRLKTRLPGVSW